MRCFQGREEMEMSGRESQNEKAALVVIHMETYCNYLNPFNLFIAFKEY